MSYVVFHIRITFYFVCDYWLFVGDMNFVLLFLHFFFNWHFLLFYKLLGSVTEIEFSTVILNCYMRYFIVFFLRFLISCKFRCRRYLYRCSDVLFRTRINFIKFKAIWVLIWASLLNLFNDLLTQRIWFLMYLLLIYLIVLRTSFDLNLDWSFQSFLLICSIWNVFFLSKVILVNFKINLFVWLELFEIRILFSLFFSYL